MTLILDTNVLSALMLEPAQQVVLEWLADQNPDYLFTTTICQAEIRSGIAMMPVGRRRARLQGAAALLFEVDFAGRVLPFDTAAADCHGTITAARRRAGRSVSTMDHLIAAIALNRGASVATRNVGDVSEAGVNVINPWLPSAR